MRMNISDNVVWLNGAHNNLLSPIMKWIVTLLYKQWSTADQKNSQKGVKVKGTLGLKKPEGIRYLQSKL